MNKSDTKFDSHGAKHAASDEGADWQSGDAGGEIARLLGGIGAAPDFAAFGERMIEILHEMRDQDYLNDSCDAHAGRDS